MHFETYVPARDCVTLNEPIEDILPIIVRYVYRGRNAWYSTWVTHYFDGCFHDAPESAKRFAETHRGPGNVFHVEDIPALAFLGRDHCGVAAQINVSTPFAQYLVRSREQRAARLSVGSALYEIKDEAPFSLGSSGELVSCWMGAALAMRGHPISVALASFEPKSPYWSEAQSTENSIIRAWQARSSLALEVLTENSLDRVKSVARGANYPLRWHHQRTSNSHEHVIALADELDRILDAVLK